MKEFDLYLGWGRERCFFCYCLHVNCGFFSEENSVPLGTLDGLRYFIVTIPGPSINHFAFVIWVMNYLKYTFTDCCSPSPNFCSRFLFILSIDGRFLHTRIHLSSVGTPGGIQLFIFLFTDSRIKSPLSALLGWPDCEHTMF